MKKTLLFLSAILVIVALFNSCERDDICAEATPTTPKLIIEFFDAQNRGNSRNVNSLSIREIENDTDTLYNSTSTIGVPLKTNAIETTYVFNINSEAESGGLTDTLTFSYANEELYVSRACGFKVNFIDLRAQLQNSNSNWIDEIQVVNNTIENEAETHLFIYY